MALITLFASLRLLDLNNCRKVPRQKEFHETKQEKRGYRLYDVRGEAGFSHTHTHAKCVQGLKGEASV